MFRTCRGQIAQVAEHMMQINIYMFYNVEIYWINYKSSHQKHRSLPKVRLWIVFSQYWTGAHVSSPGYQVLGKVGAAKTPARVNPQDTCIQPSSPGGELSRTFLATRVSPAPTAFRSSQISLVGISPINTKPNGYSRQAFL